jgi:tetratricopeptide (TPR) repeat protein
MALLLVGAIAGILFHHYAMEPNRNSLSYDQKQGLADAATGECTAAIPLLNSVIGTSSDGVAATESLGECYVVLGESESAMSPLQFAASHDPSLSNEASLAKAAFFSGNSAVVRSAMKEAAAKATSPSDVLTVVSIDQSYGIYPAADNALRRMPYALRTYVWYSDDATNQLDLGNPGDAVSAAARAVQLAPVSSRGALLASLGNAYASAGRYAAAATTYRKALSTRQPIDTSAAYSELAQCYINLNRYWKALAITHIGLENITGAGRSDLQISEAMALAELRHFPQAIRLLKAVAASPSASASDLSNASSMLSALGD